MERPAALVTGASRGIGRAIAIELARAGYDVGVNYARNVEAATEVVREVEAQGGRAAPLQADISRSDDRERLLAEFRKAFQRVDLLVNNAGIAPRKRQDVLEASEASFDEVFGINLKGPFFLTRDVARWMVELRSEHADRALSIVNISSVSEYAPSTARPDYCMAKAGLGMMTKLFAVRLGPHEIRVNAVRPGLIETDMTHGVHDQYTERIEAGLTPIRRWGTAEEVARAVRALASGDFAFATAAVVDLDGGFRVRVL